MGAPTRVFADDDNILFGAVVFGGDFQQTLPIVCSKQLARRCHIRFSTTIVLMDLSPGSFPNCEHPTTKQRRGNLSNSGVVS
jgi:hypothetical protein